MYDKLIKELREYWNDGTEDLRNQAADAIEGLLHAVDQMTEWRKNQWIPVEERLPEDRKMVLAAVDGVVCIAFYGNYMWEEVGTYSIFYPTHWMPLPQPPKREGE